MTAIAEDQLTRAERHQPRRRSKIIRIIPHIETEDFKSFRKFLALLAVLRPRYGTRVAFLHGNLKHLRGLPFFDFAVLPLIRVRSLAFQKMCLPDFLHASVAPPVPGASSGNSA